MKDLDGSRINILEVVEYSEVDDIAENSYSIYMNIKGTSPGIGYNYDSKKDRDNAIKKLDDLFCINQE